MIQFVQNFKKHSVTLFFILKPKGTLLMVQFSLAIYFLFEIEYKSDKLNPKKQSDLSAIGSSDQTQFEPYGDEI